MAKLAVLVVAGAAVTAGGFALLSALRKSGGMTLRTERLEE